MNNLFEENDVLNSPYEAFSFDTESAGLPIKSHWHYFMEIIYIIKGSVLVNCSKEEYILKPGDMILFYPQTLHSIYAASEDQIKYDVIKFDINTLKINSSYTPKLGAIFRNAEIDNKAQIFFSANVTKNLKLETLFKSCIAEIENQDYGYDIKLQSMITSLLIEILRIWRTFGFDTNNSAAVPDETDSLYTILQYIDEHSQEPLKVQELADKCHMSYYYFARKFRELYGQSCKDYIEFVRISKSKDLLLFTDFDLSYISQETGFSDCSHLIRVFKRNTGTTPKRFREDHKHKSGAI